MHNTLKNTLEKIIQIIFNYTSQSAHLAAIFYFDWLLILGWYEVTHKITLYLILNAKFMNM